MLYLTTDIECDIKLNVNVPNELGNIESSSQFIDNSDFYLNMDSENLTDKFGTTSLIWQQFARFFKFVYFKFIYFKFFF